MPIARILPASRDKSAEQLEAENAELRRRVTELVLEIEAFREE
jgi:cell division protein FtsB